MAKNKTQKPIKIDKDLYRELKLLLKEKGLSGNGLILRVYHFFTKVLQLSRKNLKQEKKTLCYILSEEGDFHPFLISQLLFEMPCLKKRIEEKNLTSDDLILSVDKPSLIQCFDDEVFHQLKSQLDKVINCKIISMEAEANVILETTPKENKDEIIVNNQETILEVNEEKQLEIIQDVQQSEQQETLKETKDEVAELLNNNILSNSIQEQLLRQFCKMETKFDDLIAEIKISTVGFSTSIDRLSNSLDSLNNSFDGISRNICCLYELKVAKYLQLQYSNYQLSSSIVEIGMFTKKNKMIAHEFASELLNSSIDSKDMKSLQILEMKSIGINYLLQNEKSAIIMEVTMSSFDMDEQLLRKLVELERQIICYGWKDKPKIIELVGLASPSHVKIERVESLCKKNQVLLRNVSNFVQIKKFILHQVGNKRSDDLVEDWE